MLDYPAIIDSQNGAYGVVFPDLPGVVAMGETVEEAIAHAGEALLDYVVEAEAHGDEIISPCRPENVGTSAGQTLVSIPLVRQRTKVEG